MCACGCLRLEILCATDQVKEEPSNIYRAQNHTKEEGKLVSAAASFRDVTGGEDHSFGESRHSVCGEYNMLATLMHIFFFKKIVYCAS